MKTTLDLPDELIREVKLRAVIQGRSLKDLVANFLRQELGNGTTRAIRAAARWLHGGDWAKRVADDSVSYRCAIQPHER